MECGYMDIFEQRPLGRVRRPEGARRSARTSLRVSHQHYPRCLTINTSNNLKGLVRF